MTATGFRTTRVELRASIGGELWLPSCTAWKEFKATVRRDNAPFAFDWPGTMRELLIAADTHEGCDFSNCRYLNAVLIIERRTPSGIIRRRVVDLSRWPDCSDLFHSTAAGLAILDASCSEED